MTATRGAPGIILWKDLLTERRSQGEPQRAPLLLPPAALRCSSSRSGPTASGSEAALPGLLWLGFILAGLLGLGRSFMVERDNDCWEGLRLTPGDKSAIYLGKLARQLS